MLLIQAKSKINNDNVVLDGLVLVIIMRDFYQFFLITKRSL